MVAVANNPKFAKKVGIPKSVGDEFMKADKNKKFKNGGVINSLRKAGFYNEANDKTKRLSIINKVTTKPERLEMVDKLFLKKKAEGGSLKSVDEEQNPGLAKLPTEVRNKMGYMKSGGLYANIQAKRQRIAQGSGEKMRKPNSKGAPSSQNFVAAAKTAKMKHGGGVQNP